MSVQAAQREGLKVRLDRTLDLDSPRVVPAQLFEHIRLTDFCLVDLTTLRPNVLFELGVRLAASRLHPVVVHDPALDPAGDEPWQSALRAQGAQLRRLLDVIEYSPTADNLDHIRAMVNRHVELRRLDEPAQLPHPRQRTVLDGFPPRGVHDLAWRYADPDEEVVSIPVSARLAATGDSLLLNPSKGSGHLLYPEGHRLTKVAQRCGREYLVAAWLYRHFRDGTAIGVDGADTERLLNLLRQTGDPADAAFAEQIAKWRADTNGDQA